MVKGSKCGSIGFQHATTIHSEQSPTKTTDNKPNPHFFDQVSHVRTTRAYNKKTPILYPNYIIKINPFIDILNIIEQPFFPRTFSPVQPRSSGRVFSSKTPGVPGPLHGSMATTSTSMMTWCCQVIFWNIFCHQFIG